jgi:uncharacterized protein
VASIPEAEPGPAEVEVEVGEAPGLLIRPSAARWLYLLAHGAGAGMCHPFLAGVAGALGARGVATLRWQLPYLAAGRRRPDPPAVLVASVRAAGAAARRLAPELRIVGGGKSLGGRMTSTALAAGLEGIEALIFLGFPLHPAGRPGTRRADHLRAVAVPMLFVQGTRDALAEPALLGPVIAQLGDRATYHEIAGADHAFAVRKRDRRDGPAVIDEIADVIAAWLAARGPAA